MNLDDFTKELDKSRRVLNDLYEFEKMLSSVNLKVTFHDNFDNCSDVTFERITMHLENDYFVVGEGIQKSMRKLAFDKTKSLIKSLKKSIKEQIEDGIDFDTEENK